MGWLFVALSVLGFLWALIHLRTTLSYLGVIPPTRGVSLALASGAAVDTIRTIAWSIVLLVVEWPVLVTWVVLVWAIAQLLGIVLWRLLILQDFDEDPQQSAAGRRMIRQELDKQVLGRLVFVFILAVAFVACVYKLGI